MEVTARLGEIDEALGALPVGDRRAAVGPVLAELCLPGLPLDEDAISSLTRRALLLAAAAGAVAGAPSPGGRPVLETAADLADEGLGRPLEVALAGLAEVADEAGARHVAAAARGLADRRDEALEALAAALLAAALAE